MGVVRSVIEMGKKEKTLLTAKELANLMNQFYEWIHSPITKYENSLAVKYGENFEEVDKFVAYCVGYLAGKQEAEKTS
jgi:hypothetical protein